MLGAEPPLGDADVARLATLHVRSIDDSVPALVGEGFARRLYAFLAASERELLLVERVDGRVEGACVVSFAPASLQGRIARAHPTALVRAALTKPAFRSFLWQRLRHAFAGGVEPEKAPEISYIFSAPESRSRQLGRRLIEQVDDALRGRNVARYYVKTLDDPANRAIEFYERNGFERIGVREEGGRRFVEFHKHLGAR